MMKRPGSSSTTRTLTAAVASTCFAMQHGKVVVVEDGQNDAAYPCGSVTRLKCLSRSALAKRAVGGQMPPLTATSGHGRTVLDSCGRLPRPRLRGVRQMQLLTVQEFAEAMKVSEKTIRRLIKRGDLAAYKEAIVVNYASPSAASSSTSSRSVSRSRRRMTGLTKRRSQANEHC